MGQYFLSPSALSDLKDIAAYTQKHWDLDQRDAYIRHLAKAFARLAKSPEMGRSRPEVRKHLRSYVCREHVIFYRTTKGDDVEVLRVLHQSRDIRHSL